MLTYCPPRSNPSLVPLSLSLVLQMAEEAPAKKEPYNPGAWDAALLLS